MQDINHNHKEITTERLTGVAEILIPRFINGIEGGLDYIIPPEMIVYQGSYVIVAIGNRETLGVVWNKGKTRLEAQKYKTIKRVFNDIPPMTEDMRKFIDWVSQYNCAAKGMVLKLALSTPKAITNPAKMTIYRAADNMEADKLNNIRITPARKRVIDFMMRKKGASYTMSTMVKECDVTPSVVNGLVELGIIERREITGEAENIQQDICQANPENKKQLSDEQKNIAISLCSKLDKGFSVTLLEGVTGSGKTEVYFEAIEQALTKHKQVFIMLPEIALSVQLAERFRQRFRQNTAIWHSSISMGKRQKIWRDVAGGKIRIIVGARSALFLPFAELGLIVVDEEHDSSYKQEDGVIYQARDMAIVRASIEKIPVILVSATPSLETLHNVEIGKYDSVQLPKRYGTATMPKVKIINMTQEKLPAGRFISSQLKDAIAKTLNADEQVMLFLNRRGYAPLVICRKCGHRFECPNCTTSLVLHQNNNLADDIMVTGGGKLECHQCGYNRKMPDMCPECIDIEEINKDTESTLVACGPGIERLQEEIKTLFPDTIIRTLTSETVSSRPEMEKVINEVIQHRVDIIIGTQMLAKGHHFPNLTMVGIVDADMALKGGDIRAVERTYQLLHQISGRAGREKRQGSVMIQTYQPDHEVMRALERGEGKTLLAKEMQYRKQANMPPFGRLVALIIEGTNEQEVKNISRNIIYKKPSYKKIKILGPTPAPLYKLRNNYRYRILIIADKRLNIQNIIKGWLNQINIPSRVKCKIDIDPYSFM